LRSVAKRETQTRTAWQKGGALHPDHFRLQVDLVVLKGLFEETLQAESQKEVEKWLKEKPEQPRF